MLNIVKGIFQFIINVLLHWNEEKKKIKKSPWLKFSKVETMFSGPENLSHYIVWRNGKLTLLSLKKCNST